MKIAIGWGSRRSLDIWTLYDYLKKADGLLNATPINKEDWQSRNIWADWIAPLPTSGFTTLRTTQWRI
ncbi:MAG: hypothetical protein LBL45_00835 [Treponema sp.]|jgi:hypothetical protein|nr:hypothetical protein [Treponema sp.]